MDPRLKPFGCFPVLLGLGVASVVIFFSPTDELVQKLRMPTQVIISLFGSLIFVAPVYVVSILVAKKRIALHLMVALLAYALLWASLLASEQSRTLSVLLEQAARRSITYWLLYCVFFLVMMIVWRILLQLKNIKAGITQRAGRATD